MGAEPMHGPLALTIFWLWLGLVLFGVLIYILLLRRLNRTRGKPPRPMKYAEQLRQRMRSSAPSRTPLPPDGADPARRRAVPKK